MDNSFIRAITAAFTGNTIVKPAANSQNQIGFLNGVVGAFVSVRSPVIPKNRLR